MTTKDKRTARDRAEYFREYNARKRAAKLLVAERSSAAAVVTAQPISTCYGAQTLHLEHWTNKRAAARAAAKVALDAAREKAIDDMAARSRKAARACGAPRFIGRPCSRHDNAERYIANGECVFCKREKNDAMRGVARPPENLRVRPMRRSFPTAYNKNPRWSAAPELLDE